MYPEVSFSPYKSVADPGGFTSKEPYMSPIEVAFICLVIIVLLWRPKRIVWQL